MNVDKKVKELLSKDYRMDYWDCRNDEPNSEEWMLEQAIENSLIVVEEILIVLESNDIEGYSQDLIYFWQEVENKLKTMLDEFK
ncbi:MAG TPA: hypothetical protein VLA48_03455 [Nitrososphaeraceae archaeon]|nr:hypothetical protein [Nitrososphaeraceae archaeon]